MTRPYTCDRRECPAPALHHADIHGQDFHFCNHHWEELPPGVALEVEPRHPTSTLEPASLTTSLVPAVAPSMPTA